MFSQEEASRIEQTMNDEQRKLASQDFWIAFCEGVFLSTLLWGAIALVRRVRG